MAISILRTLARNSFVIREKVAFLTPSTVAAQNKAAWAGSVSWNILVLLSVQGHLNDLCGLKTCRR